MKEQKDRSRAATSIDAEDWTTVNPLNENIFVGYDSLETEASIIKYRKVKAKGKEIYQVVLDRTPFYAESGGQVGDTGELFINGSSTKVIDTKKENDMIIHIIDKLPAVLDGKLSAKVNAEKRKHTAVHHSATHLLHAALRKVLGTHVAQKGSLVNAEYLRFDFSHFSKMSKEEIRQVEEMVNEKIRQNIPVVIKTMPRDEAMKTGAMALFGEKYGETVRVVTIDPYYSIELCGGTHVGNTGELGIFRISSEAAIAAGVRRIEAVSGKAAENSINKDLEELQSIKDQLKNPADPLKAISGLQEEGISLKKKLEKYELAQVSAIKEQLLQKVADINGSRFLGAVVSVSSADALKKLAFEISKQERAIIVLAADIEGKASVVLSFDEKEAALKNLDAGALIKQKIAPLIKGGGGGQKTLATAGGQDISGLQNVIEAVKASL